VDGRGASGTSVTMDILTSADALACPTVCATFAARLGFNERATSEIEIAAAELATNLLRHAGGGTLTVRAVLDPFAGLELITTDNGPGFADVETALRDGFSQGKDLVLEVPPTQRAGLGAGMGAIRRLMDELHIENRPEGGAIVTASKRLP